MIRFINEVEIEVIEFLMALCLSKKTLVLSFLDTKNEQIGTLYVKAGNFIHAEIKRKDEVRLIGDKALHAISKWEKTIVSILPFNFPEEITIHSDWRDIFFYDLKKCYEEFVVEKVAEGRLTIEYITNPKLCELPKVKNMDEKIKLELKKYLSWVPHALKDMYIMNAFCNEKGEIYACLKNDELFKDFLPRADEIYIQLKSILKIKNNPSLKPIVSSMGERLYLIVHLLKKNLYSLVLTTKNEVSLLDEVIQEMSKTPLFKIKL